MAKGDGSGNHASPRGKKATTLSERALGSVQLASMLGLSISDSAALLKAGGLVPEGCKNFSHMTLRRMMERDKRVAQAVDIGRATGRYRVAQSIYEMATRDGNLGAAIYWERTRNPDLVAVSECVLEFGKAKTKLASAEHSVEGVDAGTEVFVYLPDNGRDEGRATHQLASSVEPGAVDVFYEHQEGDLVQNPDLALKRLPQAE